VALSVFFFNEILKRRFRLILAKDLGYADTQRLTTSLEEVSRLLGAYAAAILSSASRLP